MAQAIAQAESALISSNLTADSRVIADRFERRHAEVLRSIRKIVDQTADWGQCNFAPIKINDLTGETTSHVEMTRDGFALLVMGFTGRKAMAWKIKFLEAFNAMEEQLRTQPQPVADLPFEFDLLLSEAARLSDELWAASDALMRAREIKASLYSKIEYDQMARHIAKPKSEVSSIPNPFRASPKLYDWFKEWLGENGYSLSGFCREFDLPHSTVIHAMRGNYSGPKARAAKSKIKKIVQGVV